MNNARRTDPSRTTLIRNSYTAACFRRLKKLRTDLTTSIVDQDCFGLATMTRFRIHDVSGFQQFAFTTDARKHDAFMEWLRQQIELNMLETVDRNGNPVDPTWQDVYVRAAYQRGVTQAVAAVGAAVPGSVPIVPVTASFFFQPVHLSSLELLFTRNYEALKNITDTMASSISRELTLGFAQGLSPLQIAKNLRDMVNGIGLIRARVMARTEVIHAHAQATLNVYEQMGVEEVGAEVEMQFSSALDAFVCPKCKALESKVFTLKKARGVIPVHPNCRCIWKPFIATQQQRAA